MDVRDVLSLASPSPRSRRPLKPPPPPSFNDQEFEAKRPKIDAKQPDVSTISDVPSVVELPKLVDSTSSSSNHEGLTTVGASEVSNSTIYQLSVLLEKRALANQEARTKFPDQPKRFMQSEVDLQETLEEMQILAANPSLYPILAEETRCISLLLGLLAHENADISLAVIDLLHELVESNGLIEAGLEKVNGLLNLLFNNQLIQLLMQNVNRLDETNKDEAEGVHKTLGIVENLLDVRPEMNVMMADQGLFAWLLRRLQRRPVFDRNKLYASEILSILLQMDEINRRHLGEVDGIDTLLQLLASYKRNDPSSREEAEFMLNLFDCLCSALMLPENKDRFLKGEGIQLMNLMLREKHMSRDSALRVLDYTLCLVNNNSASNKITTTTTTTTNQSTEIEAVVIANCSKFVEILGLRTLFPLFMHSPREFSARIGASSKNNKKNILKSLANAVSGPTTKQMEEHVINIVGALLRFCPEHLKSRVLTKFVENDHEKVDRLMELYLNYSDAVKQTDLKIELLRQNKKRWAGLTEEEIEEELTLKRMEGGLLTLHVLSIIILDICVNDPSTITDRVIHLFRMRSLDITSVLNNAQEYVDGFGTASVGSEVTRVSDLIERCRVLFE